LIQLCDELMASGAHAECIAGLEPVAVKVFSNMGGASILGRAQQQDAQATKEVLFYMLQKTMHQRKVLDLVSCVLSLSQEHPESYYRWSELASDTLLNLLSQRSVEVDCTEAISSVERLLDSVYRDVLLDQSRVELVLKILFKAPPDQATTPYKLKLRYLSIIMVLLRKVLILVPESEILLSINYLKATLISPQAIFFNVKLDIDPLNVQSVNENCANLSPDVILVRFLFKTLTFAITEMDCCHEASCSDLNRTDINGRGQNHSLLYAVCVNIIVQVKHMLHLTNGCLFPLTAKTAQTILHNEQSGLNTGLYSPDENIPLDFLNLICLRSAHRAPLLTVHWSHLLIRLNFLSHKYWQKLIGFARNLPLSSQSGDTQLLCADILQIACVMAYCEYFVENGLSEAVHLTWLLVNRVHILVHQYHSEIVQKLIDKVQQTAGASGLLLQAIAARCQTCLKDEFALNTYKILTLCHESQSGPLVFLICRIIGKLEPAIAVRFAKLAVDRCRMLKDMSIEKINVQLSKEDVQVALELLQREQVHIRYSSLVMELNTLASSVFDLSPLDLSQDRAINPQYITTTNVDANWLLNQVKSRCCQAECSAPKVPKHKDLALLLANMSKEELKTIMTCSEFDRKLLSSCFKVSCDNFLREFLNNLSVHETREVERDATRQQREMAKNKEEMTSSIDSNKLNVVNSLHVFKKSDNKESKSQFFIPISDTDINDKFGNLELSDDEIHLVLPDIPDLYKAALTSFDKSLSEVIRQFPKQNRPLSQSENFKLNGELTIDRYTRRCHQVFQDKLFYEEFVTLQTVLSGFLESVDRIMATVDEADCDLLDKAVENIIPPSLAKNIAVFTVISLQYLSFLIKNKTVVESPVPADVSFRVTAAVTENVIVDNVIQFVMENVAQALSFEEIWCELNVDNNLNRTQSSISCLYAVVKYVVKDTRPLVLKNFMKIEDAGPQTDLVLVADKLVTLIDYWEQCVYVRRSECVPKCYIRPVENLIISLSRLDLISNIALIPPIAWPSVDVVMKNRQIQKIDLPLQALQDMDVLEAFLFRVNLIGWSSKKQFEEVWVGLLGALQGNGTHWAVRGITQLLINTAPKVRRRGLLHVPRDTYHVGNGMQRLRNILVGTSAYKIFDSVNLERIPLANDGVTGYHYGQFSMEYLKAASELSEVSLYKIRQHMKRVKRHRDIDVNSCLQLLMDVTSQMLDPKASTGTSARVALVSSVGNVAGGGSFSSSSHWYWAGALSAAATGATHAHLAQYTAAARALLHALSLCVAAMDDVQEISTVHQKLVKSLSSSYAPLRQAALHGCLLQLTVKNCTITGTIHPYQELVTQLDAAVRQYLAPNSKISLYEQSLYWSVLFTLIELGHPDLINLAVDFVLSNHGHYCTDLVVRGIINTIRRQLLPKELKKTMIEKFLHNMKSYSEQHAIQIVLVHLFSADNKLLSPKLTSDVSNMDPDVLMYSMERVTLLYKMLRQCQSKENKAIVASVIKYFLRETLPPAATLSRVVIEFLECCKETERTEMGLLNDRERWIDCSVLSAEIVFEVFETAVSQDQLPVLSGWIFEALCHLLAGKISSSMLPYCVLTLLVSASSNEFVRKIGPLCYNALRLGFCKSAFISNAWGVFREFLKGNGVTISFSDRRILCVVATHSNFSESQLEKLRQLCDSSESLVDLSQCLEIK
ncbi:hypothetical protein ACJJTC_003627, partial [Scirpophaga incertulas]